MTSNALAT